jgi:hypothetical protein
MTARELEQIWPISWQLSGSGQCYVATVLGERIEAYPRTDNVVFPLGGVGMPGNTLREKLQAAREVLLRRIETLPDVLPEPPMIDRLEAMLKPLGWNCMDAGVFLWAPRVTQVSLHYVEHRLSVCVNGTRVLEELLMASATDEQIRTVLSRLLDFPRWP